MNLNYSINQLNNFISTIRNNQEAVYQIAYQNNGGYIDFYKKGGKPKIYIKKSNRGKFTEYCGGSVTQECIRKGKNSPDPKIRKRAIFAANVRKFKHKSGGKIKLPLYNGKYIEVSNITKDQIAGREPVCIVRGVKMFMNGDGILMPTNKNKNQYDKK